MKFTKKKVRKFTKQSEEVYQKKYGSFKEICGQKGRSFQGSLMAVCRNTRRNFKEISLKFLRGRPTKFAGSGKLFLSKIKNINL